MRVQGHYNPLNAELNPVCHLLALLGAHLILHVNRIRVKDQIPVSYFKKRETLTERVSNKHIALEFCLQRYV